MNCTPPLPGCDSPAVSRVSVLRRCRSRERHPVGLQILAAAREWILALAPLGFLRRLPQRLRGDDHPEAVRHEPLAEGRARQAVERLVGMGGIAY